MLSQNTSLLENLAVIKEFTKAIIKISRKRQTASTGDFNKNIYLYVNDGFH
jgi:hypothetical protein